MAVSASIRLVENMTAPINNIIGAAENLTDTMNDVQTAGRNAFEGDTLQTLHQEIETAQAEMQELAGKSETVGDEIRKNTSAQGEFNNKTSGLIGIVGKLAAAYMSLNTIRKVIDISDELTQTRARLDMMNDGLQTTDELTRMVQQSAKAARGSYSSMAGVVARFGNNAGDAFANTAEVVRFAELVQKQMTIAGASTAESSNAMLQLSQALGSGVLRGDELNSIFEQAPNLIRTIADYLGVSIGQIREMASEGEITAEIVKNAILSSADDINTQFENMPTTWGQRWQAFKNDALAAFEPVLVKINNIANSERFDVFAAKATDFLYTFSNAVVYALDELGNAAAFVYDHWDVLGPLIVYAAWALGSYIIALKAYNFAQAFANGLTSAAAFASGIHSAALAMESGATFTATAATYGFNAALLACPVTWLLLALGALGVGFVVLSNKVGGTKIAILILKDCFKTGMEDMMLFFHSGYVEIANTCDEWAQVFHTLGTQITVAMGNAKIGVLQHMREMVVNTANMINKLIGSVTKLFGLSIPTVDVVADFAVTGIDNIIAEQEKKNADALAKNKEYLAQKQAAIQARNDVLAATKAQVEADRKARSDEIVTNMTAAFVEKEGLELTNPMEQMAASFAAPQTVADIAEKTAGIADNTSNIADKMNMSDEDLKFLRDMAAREAINQFTTAEVKVELGGVTNNLNSDMDIDGFINVFTDKVEEAMLMAAEGVHT